MKAAENGVDLTLLVHALALEGTDDVTQQHFALPALRGDGLEAAIDDEGAKDTAFVIVIRNGV